ncbi:hypothetical protein [Duganella hordei]|uniref:hypothetical protein n=1 Tax=Duganella hordei TaxID=2865934 RepID=UPI003342588F
MNWEPKSKNPALLTALDDYRDFVMRIATVYAGTRLIENIDLSALHASTKLALSDDFSESMTTIRTVAQLTDSIGKGEYGQLVLGLAIIQLCTAFEIFFDSAAAAYAISVSRSDAFDATHGSFSVKIGNKALMQIRKIHEVKGFTSPTNSDEALIKLSAIVEARNCYTHCGGVVRTQKAKDRLSAYGIKSVVGQKLGLKDNFLDDFLHYMAIHVMAVVNNAP